MWSRWFTHQCVGVGWASAWGYHLQGGTKHSHGWSRTRSLLAGIAVGDRIVVALPGNRVGRIGEVTGKAVEDHQWEPLVPPRRDRPEGEMGRRIFVRWDLLAAPPDRELVVVLPPGERLSLGELRPTLAPVRSRTLQQLKRSLEDPSNWTRLVGRFGYEKSLSDFIAAYPHRLEDGLLRHPDDKVRERVFTDRGRADVLLLDRDEVPVIVECKQDAPDLDAIRQLRRYLERLRIETGRTPRGVLVHGGSNKLRDEVRREARRSPRIELVQYRVDVDFVPSR